MLKLLRLVEKAFVVFSLLLSTSALIPLLLGSEDPSTSLSDPITPVFTLVVYIVTLFLATLRWKSFVRVAPKDMLIWLLVGIALASVFWTSAPDITLRRSIALLGTTLFGAYLAARYSLREQLQLLGWTLGIVVLLSIVFALALPSYGVMSTLHVGAWRGIMNDKNILGRLMTLSSVVFLLLAISNGRYQWIAWAGYSLSFCLILLSTSKTALIVFFVLMAILPLYRAWRWNHSQVIPLLITLVLVGGGAATIFLDNLGFVADALGKDLTLTGRTDIWALVLEMIEQRPLLGYGFNGFWQGWDGEGSAYIWRTLQWPTPYAHNGFLDLTLELGLLGLVVFLFSLLTVYLRGVTWSRMTRTVEGLWPLMYITFLVMYNLTEGSLLGSNSIFWILYVAMTLSIAVESNRVKKTSYQSIMLDRKRVGTKALNVKNI